MFDINLETLILTGIFLSVSTIISMGLYSLVQPHKIDGYYISSMQSGGVAVKASIQWDQDDVVFVTDDIDKAIKVQDSLNNRLK